MRFSFGLVAACLLPALFAKTYFKEEFGAGWENRWVNSNWKESSGQQGQFTLSAGDFYGDAEADKGLFTSQDARFYTTSAKIEEFSNKGKDLVVQLSVKNGQKIDCGGGYVKLIPGGLDQANFNGDSSYNIMFGPDICGHTHRTHVIFNYKGDNKLVKKEIQCETDQLTHVYTLIVRPDQTYEVRIDGVKKQDGNLIEDWDFLKPKTIKDPSVSKPADWVDEAQIDDPTDVKPEGWDAIPKTIADPEAEKPADWDDEADGTWEAPQIDNPEYKGEWHAKRIANPEYKGVWVHPEIANPEYVEDTEIYAFDSNAFIGIDVWQVKSGTVFDNIIITDSVAEAEALLAETYTKNKDAEKASFDALEAKKKEAEEAERKAAEATKTDAAAEADEDEDDDKDEL
jgi:calreticulin